MLLQALTQAPVSPSRSEPFASASNPNSWLGLDRASSLQLRRRSADPVDWAEPAGQTLRQDQPTRNGRTPHEDRLRIATRRSGSNLIAVKPRVVPTELKAKIEDAFKRSAELDAKPRHCGSGGQHRHPARHRALARRERGEPLVRPGQPPGSTASRTSSSLRPERTGNRQLHVFFRSRIRFAGQLSSRRFQMRSQNCWLWLCVVASLVVVDGTGVGAAAFVHELFRRQSQACRPGRA